MIDSDSCCVLFFMPPLPFRWLTAWLLEQTYWCRKSQLTPFSKYFQRNAKIVHAAVSPGLFCVSMLSLLYTASVLEINLAPHNVLKAPTIALLLLSFNTAIMTGDGGAWKNTMRICWAVKSFKVFCLFILIVKLVILVGCVQTWFHGAVTGLEKPRLCFLLMSTSVCNVLLVCFRDLFWKWHLLNVKGPKCNSHLLFLTFFFLNSWKFEKSYFCPGFKLLLQVGVNNCK